MAAMLVNMKINSLEILKPKPMWPINIEPQFKTIRKKNCFVNGIINFFN